MAPEGSRNTCFPAGAGHVKCTSGPARRRHPLNFEADPPEAALSPVPTPEPEPQPAPPPPPYSRKDPSPFETVFIDDQGILPGWGLLIFIAILAGISAVFFM